MTEFRGAVVPRAVEGLRRWRRRDKAVADRRKAIAELDALDDRTLHDIGVDRPNSDYVRHVMHHEFFHIVDWSGASWRWRVPEWKKLNALKFQYGKGGHTMQQDAKSWSLASGTPGFLNRYSRSSVAEDMAEMYAFLMTRPKAVASSIDPKRLGKVGRYFIVLNWLSEYGLSEEV